jgi:hypothetical protein
MLAANYLHKNTWQYCMWVITAGSALLQWVEALCYEPGGGGSIPDEVTVALRSTEPLTTIRTMGLNVSNGWPAPKADKLTAICEPIVQENRILDVSHPCRPPRPVTRTTMTSEVSISGNPYKTFLEFLVTLCFLLSSKGPILVPTLSQMKPVHTIPSNFFTLQ